MRRTSELDRTLARLPGSAAARGLRYQPLAIGDEGRHGVLRLPAPPVSARCSWREAYTLSRSARLLLATAIIGGLMLALALGAIALAQTVAWAWQQAIVEAMNARFSGVY